MATEKVEEQVTAAGSQEAPAPLAETAAPAADVAPEPQIDWKARAEALEKQVGDFRSNEIARVQGAERDRLQRSTYDSVVLLAEAMEEVAPGIKAKLEALQTKMRQEGTTDEFTARRNEIAAEVAALAKGLELEGFDERVGLDAAKHPEFQVAINYWSQAIEQQKPYLMERALAEAQVAARKIEKARTSKTQQESAKTIKDTVAAAVQRALDRAGVKDLDGGRDAGGGGDQSWRSLSPEAGLALGLRQQREREAAR